jgi:dihydroflavonol-4-reductase
MIACQGRETQMNTVLVTGASSFLGYHVAKRLNASGVRPRVLESRESKPERLDGLDVDRRPGHLEDPAAIRAACADVDTVLHLAFKVSLGGGAGLLDQMRRINVVGTTNLLQAAAAAGVSRAVVAGSALAIGVNKDPAPIDESATWSRYAFDLPYANIRRDAELAALALATPSFAVLTVCPAFTLGPDDPVGAPANTLIERLIAGRLRVTVPVGFGILDVRDFADGMLRAAERGRSGQRYLLSGENVTTSQFLGRAATIASVRAPWIRPPTILLHGVVGALGLLGRIRRKPAPMTRHVLQIIGRYAWYDTTKARAELGWMPRPLDETLGDTIHWLRRRA